MFVQYLSKFCTIGTWDRKTKFHVQHLSIIYQIQILKMFSAIVVIHLPNICPRFVQLWFNIGQKLDICPKFVQILFDQSFYRSTVLVWHSPGNALYQFYHHVWFSSDSMKPSGHLVVPDNPCNIHTKYTLLIYQTYAERREPGMSISKPQQFWGCVQILTSGSSGFTVKVTSDCSLSKAKEESECRYPHISFSLIPLSTLKPQFTTPIQT